MATAAVSRSRPAPAASWRWRPATRTAEIATTGAERHALDHRPDRHEHQPHPVRRRQRTRPSRVVSIGSTSIQPSSVYLDGLGSLTLGQYPGRHSQCDDRHHGSHEPGGRRGCDDQQRQQHAQPRGRSDSRQSRRQRRRHALDQLRGDGHVVQFVGQRHHAARGGHQYRHQQQPGRGWGSADAPPWATTPSATFSDVCRIPIALAFDSSGNLYVANNGNNYGERVRAGKHHGQSPRTLPVCRARALAVRLQRQPVRGQ